MTDLLYFETQDIRVEARVERAPDEGIVWSWDAGVSDYPVHFPVPGNDAPDPEQARVLTLWLRGGSLQLVLEICVALRAPREKDTNRRGSLI